MVETIHTFDERKEEIEFYYSVMKDFEDSENSDDKRIVTIDNPKFFRIMKSNFLLMLYNLVESTVTTGLKEIYESVMNDGCSYDDLIIEIRKLWRESKIRKIYKDPSASLKTYNNQVEEIISIITDNSPLSLNREMVHISGNLDNREIKKICDMHRIRYRIETDDEIQLKNVKDKRNDLAHGTVSFGECARDLTLNDIEIIKDAVLVFIKNILEGMETYCDEKQYKK